MRKVMLLAAVLVMFGGCSRPPEKRRQASVFVENAQSGEPVYLGETASAKYYLVKGCFGGTTIPAETVKRVDKTNADVVYSREARGRLVREFPFTAADGTRVETRDELKKWWNQKTGQDEAPGE